MDFRGNERLCLVFLVQILPPSQDIPICVGGRIFAEQTFANNFFPRDMLLLKIPNLTKFADPLSTYHIGTLDNRLENKGLCPHVLREA